MMNKIGAITAFIFVVLLAMPITQQATHFNSCVQFTKKATEEAWKNSPKGGHSAAVAYCNGK